MQSGFHRTRTREQSWNSKDQHTCGWNLPVLRVIRQGWRKGPLSRTLVWDQRGLADQWQRKLDRLVPSFRSFLLWSGRTLSERDGKAQSTKRSHPSLAQGPWLLLQQRGVRCDHFREAVAPGLVSSWLSHKPLLSPVEITMLVAPGKNAEHRTDRQNFPSFK